ncbi:hypothetical protein [uncultured Clostridium sp.]|nr:hypothetical protein [uncultured Clostridium sp.]
MSKKLKALAVVMGIVGTLTLVSVSSQSVSAATKVSKEKPALGKFTVIT